MSRSIIFIIFLLVAAAAAGFWWMDRTTPYPEPAAGWDQLAPLPAPRGELTTAVTSGEDGQRLWVIGGFTGFGEVLDSVLVYDPAQNQWSEGPRLPEPRHHLAAATVNGTVYVSGGARETRDWEPHATVWRLRPGATRWEAVEAMPEPRLGHRMVAHDGLLYVVGGRGPTARVLIHDPEEETGESWRAGSALPLQRDHVMAVVVDDAVWVMGGRDGNDNNHARVDVYAIGDDQWQDGPPLPAPTSGAAEGLMDGQILVIAGEDPSLMDGGIVHQHWRLNTTAEERVWEPAPPPMLAVHGAEGAVLDGMLHIAGGSSRHGLLSVFGWTIAVQRLEDPAAPE